MSVFIQIVLSTLFVSLLSFIGLITLSINNKKLQKILLLLVSLSAGALMGGALLHLLPESLEQGVEPVTIFIYTLIGFSAFFFIEKLLFWHHCHGNSTKCDFHSFAYMNLIGDFVHNFLDGLIIAASYLTDFTLGITTTLAVFLHEIPQEIGDFGVLLHGKFSLKNALFLNFITALTAILGGIIGFFLSSLSSQLANLVLPFAAGGFIYISAADLIPEIRKESKFDKVLINYTIFIFGIIIMYALRFLEFS